MLGSLILRRLFLSVIKVEYNWGMKNVGGCVKGIFDKIMSGGYNILLEYNSTFLCRTFLYRALEQTHKCLKLGHFSF